MKLHAFDIPEARSERIAWCEQHIVGLHLAELVAELHAVHQPESSQTLFEILNDDLPVVLKTGLRSLNESQFTALLQHPECLLELQEQILLLGGDYWTQLSVQSADDAIPFNAARITDGTETRPPKTESSVSLPQKRNWYSHPAIVAVVTAAVVLVATNLRQSDGPAAGKPPAVASGWGWDRPGALKTDVSATDYLNGLADSADDWFKKRPNNARAVAKRIAQFRQGCSTLILADHAALADADKTWLVSKCQAWAAKLDSHLIAAESGKPPGEVLAAADETVRKLVAAIRARADSISV